MRALSTILLSAAAILTAAGAMAEDGRRAFVELFTSQGCSSCPPADALLAQLQHDPDLTVVSLPVDYWDYIGWKDTLAEPEFSKRQRAYAAARGDNHVYTPQVVVDGLRHVVGSDKTEILAAAASAFGERGAMKIPMTVRKDGEHLIAEVGGAEPDGAKWGGMWVLCTAHNRTVSIGRGENAGRTITYTNVVRAIHKIGDWAGRPARYEIGKSDLEASDADGYVLLLQASSGGRPGPVLAASVGRP